MNAHVTGSLSDGGSAVSSVGREGTGLTSDGKYLNRKADWKNRSSFNPEMNFITGRLGVKNMQGGEDIGM